MVGYALMPSPLCSVKSLTNPDKRVVIVKEYAKAHFSSTPVLDFAIEVLG